MRKYFVTGFYLLIVGGLLLLGGFIMGGNKSVVWNHGFKIIQKIDETYPLSNFKNVYVEGRNTNVTFRLGDRYKIRIDGEKNSEPTYKIKNNTLTVTGQERKNHVGVDLLDDNNVTITIPMNQSLDNVNVRLAEGNIKINDVTIDNFIKSAKDLDYDSNVYMSDATINNIEKMNLYDAKLTMKNSKISNANIVASAYSQITATNSTILKSSFNLDESKMNIKQSNLDTLKSLNNHSKISISKTTLMNHNDFRMFGAGHFIGSGLSVEGLDLTSEHGYVRYFDKKYGNSYQNKVDANNLLMIKTTKAPITIK